jgi:hypothetical protein
MCRGGLSLAQDLSSVLDEVIAPVLSGQDVQHGDFVDTWVSDVQ